MDDATNSLNGAPEIVYLDADGEFPLAGGGWGQPGCGCGMHDAVVRVDGEYLCRGAAEQLGVSPEPTY